MYPFLITLFFSVAKAQTVSLQIDDFALSNKKSQILVTLENNTQKSMTVPISIHPSDYWLEFVLQDSKGKVLEYRGDAVRMAFSSENLLLLPSSFYGRRFSFSEYFYIDKAGEYEMTCKFGKGPDGKILNGKIIETRKKFTVTK